MPIRRNQRLSALVKRKVIEMKWFGMAGIVAAAWMTYVTWADPWEGGYVRWAAAILGSVAFFTYFEGLKREIIESVQTSLSAKDDDPQKTETE